MLPDPYTPGQPAHVLGGRVRELGRITQRLERVAALGDYAGPLLVFHAPRGIGKTSLLRVAQRAASSAGFVTVWVSATSRSSLVAEIADALGAALATSNANAGKRGATWRAQLTGFEVQLGVPGAASIKVNADTRPAPPSAPAAPVGATVNSLEQLLRSAAALVRDSGAAGLVLFVDEVHAAPPRDLGVLLNALQNLDGVRTAIPMTVVLAGLPASPEVITAAATFGERSQFVPLTPLDREDSAVALVRPATDSGVAWERDALDRVVTDAGGYPYFVQLLGSSTWEAASPRAGSTLTLTHVRAGYEDARQQLLTLFRARWNSASKVDKTFIAAMVDEMLTSRREDVERASIAARMGKPSGALGVPRNRLIEKGIIEPSGHGTLRFTIPGFAAYVAGEQGLGDADQLRELTGFPQLGTSDRDT